MPSPKRSSKNGPFLPLSSSIPYDAAPTDNDDDPGSTLIQRILTKLFSPIFSTFTINSVQNPDKKEIEVKNTVGDLFWPLLVFLKLLGNCALSYESEWTPLKPETILNKDNDGRGGVEFKGTLKSTSREKILDIEPSENSKLDNIVNDDKVEFEYVKKFRVIYRSKFFIWSAILAIMFAINWTIVMVQTGFEIGKSVRLTYCSYWWGGVKEALNYQFQRELRILSNNTSIELNQTRTRSYLRNSIHIIFILIPLLPPVQIFFSWMETPHFSKFLNNWKNFELKFEKVFPPPQLSKISRFQLTSYRNRLIVFYALLPTLGMELALVNLDLDNSLAAWVHLIVSFPFAAQIFTATLLEDVKVLLTYRTIADSFSQIRQGIAQSKDKTLTAKNVRNWRKLVDKVKSQAELVGRYQKYHQLFLTTAYITLLTSLVFLLLQGARTGAWIRVASWKLWITGLIYAVVLMGRIYAKVLAADRIIQNESMVGLELTRIGKWTDDPDIRYEIKFLYDIVKQNPTVISFGNFVTMRKKLILGIASQVVTYLIVLMQLSQSQTRD